MAKLEYEDSSLNRPHPRRNQSIAFNSFGNDVSLLIGAIGGVGGILILSADNAALLKKLELKIFSSLAIPTTRTEKWWWKNQMQ